MGSIPVVTVIEVVHSYFAMQYKTNVNILVLYVVLVLHSHNGLFVMNILALCLLLSISLHFWTRESNVADHRPPGPTRSAATRV